MLLKSLEMFSNPILHDLIYPKTIRGIKDVVYEERYLERPFIGDQLDEGLKFWHPDRAIVIAAPTGSGKTTFVIEKLVQRAVKRTEYVLIVTNRNPLNLAYKKRVAKISGFDDIYTDEGLQRAQEFGFCYVVNYQALDGFIQSHSHIKFSYVIFDECHYFIQDAPFSDCTGSLLDVIPRNFKFSKRIYLSATIDEILPYIALAELSVRNTSNGNVCWAQPYILKNLLPIIYRIDADYSKVNLYFYENPDAVVEYLKTQESQVLAFCSTKKECKRFGDLFGNSLVIDSEYLSEHPEIIQMLVEKEGFTEKCMATTSVFSNGNNISKKSVNAVIITLLDTTEIIQMAGRRRLDFKDSQDEFSLFLPIPSLSQLNNEMFKNQNLLNEIKECRQNYKYLLSVIKDGGEYADSIRNIFEVDYKIGKYKINHLAEDKIYSYIRYLEYLYALISEKGAQAYCEKIASMFGKTFEKSMIFSPVEERRERLINFVTSYGFPLSQSEFEQFKKDFFDERLTLFGAAKADNCGTGRPIPGIRAINHRLKELDIDIEIKKENGSYILTTQELEVS